MTDNHETQITKKDPQKKHRLAIGMVIKLQEVLNMFDGTNLTLISGVDQDN